LDRYRGRRHSRAVRRVCFVLALGCSLLSSISPGQSPDEEQRLKQLFLKSRQQMEIVPSPTPTPKPTPIPAPIRRKPFRDRNTEEESRPTRPGEASGQERARRTEEPERTPVETPTPMPTPTSTPTAAPTATAHIEASISVTPPAEQERLPAATPKKRHHGWFLFGFHPKDDNDEIVIQKSGSQGEAVPAGHQNGQWRYLTPAVRQEIDEARVARNRWKYIVVHNSGTRQGNARIFDYYHRHVRRMPNGLAYHFVIGNGTSSGDGEIEIGHRWAAQLAGGHVHSDYLNYIALGICLVGDFNRDLPTRAQYEALDELIRYLRRRVGKTDGRYSIVLGHKEINPRPTDCPGNRFPLNWLHRTFPND
jgi:cell division septation protein DedD